MPFDSIFRPGLFAGQTHVLTGAGSGIGRCTAHELASLGATVVLVGRKLDKLERVRDEIADAGGTAHAVPCDIREEAQVQAMVGAALDRTGRIDGLSTTPAASSRRRWRASAGKGWETVVRTNLTGGFLCARECYTRWMNEHGGVIVNIVADMWGSMPGMGHSGAAAGRHGELHRDRGDRVGCVRRPGQRGRARLDRVVGLRHVPGVDASLPAAAVARCAPAAPRHRVGGVGGDLLPAVARRGLHLRHRAARRRRGSQREAGVAAVRHGGPTPSAPPPRDASPGRCRRTIARGRGTASTWRRSRGFPQSLTRRPAHRGAPGGHPRRSRRVSLRSRPMVGDLYDSPEHLLFRARCGSSCRRS